MRDGLITIKYNRENVKDYDIENPYNIFDGKWGGWGPRYWYKFDWSGKTVFERDVRISKENIPEGFTHRRLDYWKCCWDNELQRWRDITPAELDQLPKFKEELVPEFKFDKVMIPIIKQK